MAKWVKFDQAKKSKILESISTKPIYKVRFKDGKEATVFVKDHKLVYDSFDQKEINLDEVEEIAILGE